MPPAKKKPSLYLDGQLHFQRQMKCDYVLLAYAKDPTQDPSEVGPGRPPRYIVTADIPIKLTHQVFLQMSFGILRDRLVAGAYGADSRVTLEQDVLALYFFLGRFLTEMERCRAEVESRPPPRPAARGRGSSVRSSTTMSSSPTTTKPPLISQQQVRFQLLLEYGVDVQPLIKEGASRAKGFEDYWRQTMAPQEISEEEFYAQIGKPSGMAQECALM